MSRIKERPAAMAEATKRVPLIAPADRAFVATMTISGLAITALVIVSQFI